MAEGEVCIIIPCYNEQESIRNVIQDILENTPDGELWTILTVNDCSTDDTVKTIEATQKAVILDLPCNLGIGGAVQAGLKYASRNNFSYAVKFDGDGQHLAKNICKFISELKSGSTDVVIGSRFCIKHDGFKSTFLRQVGIKYFQWLIKLITGKTITDSTSGFRAYNHQALSFMAEHYPAFDYPEPEEIILLNRNNFRIKEIPCEMRKRQGGISCLSSNRAVYYMIKVSFSILMAALRKPENNKGLTHD
ncbi:glycosyltransferase family 2 protein [Lentisphaerota bacterium ZTH]|nr:glycosyltransferase family 2 protein [Lentisphaerota bacterium]WET05201.1 glycosyltransferase family 2 protein [Lentisphaerota bacterium ZTH]